MVFSNSAKFIPSSNLNNDSPILQEEIEEITSFRKTKKEAFTRDLYERFSKKPPNRKYIGENTITCLLYTSDENFPFLKIQEKINFVFL